MIKPIVRIEHTEIPSRLCDVCFIDNPVYVVGSAKVVWDTIFGLVYAYRYGESGDNLHLVPNRMMIESGFDESYVYGNIVQLHNVLQDAHTAYIKKWIV